ncbi:glycoside hydrolase family 3 N-terminal domain-containing protein [Thioclava sp. 'Guangxiensis']|uniref:glycoside hydrolase family 3 N-terminal domain-containing protein n=1 Tax=Thioclava sp. 'Guangxiensis' TaxID=3149044 RepID=UPI003877DACC
MTSATILGLSGLTLTETERAFFREAQPWGFILFARNIDTPDQVLRLTSDLREAVGRDAPVLIDQEGGRVQRMRAPHWREWLPPLEQAAFPDPERSFWLRARIMADELRAVGVDSNCAPCCDIAGPQTHPFLRNRCMGEDAATVARNARASAMGFLAGGVLPVIKHIPGHGRATADSHKDLPLVEACAEDLIAQDFAAFQPLHDMPMAMTAHIRFAAFDDAPATQSPVMVDLIRQVIGFDGLLMSDDLSMQALSGSIRQRAEATMAAGCDITLHCNGERSEMEEAVVGAGTLSDAAKTRAAAAIARRAMREAVDIAVLERELADLLQASGV